MISEFSKILVYNDKLDYIIRLCDHNIIIAFFLVQSLLSG